MVDARAATHPRPDSRGTPATYPRPGGGGTPDEGGPIALRVRPYRAAAALCRRECVRFIRQPNRVVGAIGQPVLFWLLFGAGLQQSFRASPTGEQLGQSFQQYYFPGTLVLIVLFTAIFSTISIIEDRHEGFLQGVLVAPIPRWSMVLGKVLGGAVMAVGQALLFLALAFTMPWEWSWFGLANLLGLLVVVSIALTGLGYLLAWRMDSTQGFHAVMSLLLLPMWLLSGAFFPLPPWSGGASWIQRGIHVLMRINPVTYAVAGVRQAMFGSSAMQALGLPSMGVCWAVTALFAILTLAASWWISALRTAGDLR